VTGLIGGILTKLLLPGPDCGGWFFTSLPGMAGSWVGAFVLGIIELP
jgi:uncharacterized membrane protein YeaQ/YmgE (transglycosylase-associated protein family)